MEECLQLMIKDLRHLQHGLDPEFRSDKFIHNKLINACQDIPACQYACFKPSDHSAGLINDFRSSITTFQKANASKTFFTDRRYHKHPNSFRPNKFHPRPSYNGGKKTCLICHKENCWSTNHSKEEREELKRLKQRIGSRLNKRMDRRVAQ